MTPIVIVCINLLILVSVVAAHFNSFGKASSIRSFYFPALFYKIGMGLGLGWLYHFYYPGGDTIYVFEDAVTLARLALTDFSAYVQAVFTDRFLPEGLHYLEQPRALFFARIVSFFSLVAGNNYWLTAVYCSLLSFGAVWYLCTVLVRFFGHRRATAAAFLFYPSAVFWSAGIIKESIAVAFVCLIVACMLWWVRKDRKSGMEKVILLVCFLLSALLLWKIKYYYAAVLVPIAISVMVLYHIRIRLLYKVLSAALVFVVLLWITSWLHPNLHGSNLLGVLVANHDLFVKVSDPGDTIQFLHLQPDLMSLLQNLPLALFSGLFRPLPWDGSTTLHLLNGLDNLALLSIVSLGMYSFLTKKIVVQEKLLLSAAVVYILLLSVLLAFSTPNFGTLMRYKAVFLPFLLYLGLIACQPLIEDRRPETEDRS